jgi:Mg2+/Co2+ transporter CorB
METATVATLGGIVVLLVLSAFFSGSETALTAASRPRMHQLEKKGVRRARLVNRLFAHKERMIGAILLGNNLVNILASALATSYLISMFGDAGVVYATAAMTLLVLIFGEVMPKSYAYQHADRLALKAAPVLAVIIAVFAPVTHAIHVLIRGVLRLFGVRLASEEAFSAAEEALRGAIELHRGDEPAVRHERDMLRSILELADVDVDEVMHHRQDIVMIDANLAPREIVERVLESPYTRLPLYSGEVDNIVGVLHVKELLRSVHARPTPLDDLNIREVATEPWFIPESTSLLDQLQAFRARREHFALVVDEYGALMGVVTLEDILEEIVGEIADEHDIMTVGIRPLKDGSYMVDGRVTIRDLNRRFEWRLPDEEAATIAGLVIHEAKLIPEVHQIFNFHGFRFEIMRRRRNRITSIRITPGPPQPPVAAPA